MSFAGAVILGERRVIGKCLICPKDFYEGEGENYVRHAASHARRDIDDLRALAPSHRNRNNIFSPEYKDPEAERHWRKVRRDMKREGRTEARPNERIG